MPLVVLFRVAKVTDSRGFPLAKPERITRGETHLMGGGLGKAGGPLQAAHLLAYGHQHLKALQLPTLQTHRYQDIGAE